MEITRCVLISDIFQRNAASSSAQKNDKKCLEAFRLSKFHRRVVRKYCVSEIDAEGVSVASYGASTGGLLHAVLHFKCAFCLMQLRLYEQAAMQFTLALKFHPRYMKAYFLRAHCYSQSQHGTQAAIADYKLWWDLAEDAEKSGVPPSPCLFDGPNDVKPAAVKKTVKKLGDVVKAELLATAKRRAEMLGRAEARHLAEAKRLACIVGQTTRVVVIINQSICNLLNQTTTGTIVY